MTGKRRKAETYWLDEPDPDELDRRARDLDRDGMMAMAAELRRRANWLRGYDE